MTRCTEAHVCKPIAIFNVNPPREMWLGEIVSGSMPEECRAETHCMHLLTPEKQVVMLLNLGDAMNFAVLAQIVHGGPVNPHWLAQQTGWALERAKAHEQLPAQVAD